MKPYQETDVLYIQYSITYKAQYYHNDMCQTLSDMVPIALNHAMPQLDIHTNQFTDIITRNNINPNYKVACQNNSDDAKLTVSAPDKFLSIINDSAQYTWYIKAGWNERFDASYEPAKEYLADIVRSIIKAHHLDTRIHFDFTQLLFQEYLSVTTNKDSITIFLYIPYEQQQRNCIQEKYEIKMKILNANQFETQQLDEDDNDDLPFQ